MWAIPPRCTAGVQSVCQDAAFALVVPIEGLSFDWIGRYLGPSTGFGVPIIRSSLVAVDESEMEVRFLHRYRSRGGHATDIDDRLQNRRTGAQSPVPGGSSLEQVEMRPIWERRICIELGLVASSDEQSLVCG